MGSKDGVELGGIAKEHIAEAHSAKVDASQLEAPGTKVETVTNSKGVKVSSSVVKDDPTVEATDGFGNKVGDVGKEVGETALAVEKANKDAALTQEKADAAKEVFAKKLAKKAADDSALRDDEPPYPEPRDMGFVADDAEAMGAELTGLFNTFRIGDRWVDTFHMEELRLHVYTSEGPVLLKSSAIVHKVVCGRLGEMLDLHTGLNHGCCGTSLVDRKIELRQILEQAYGRRLTDDEHCVVIYMWRDPEED